MNFTVADLLYSSFAFLLFALLLIPPGYTLGWALDLVSFRKQDPAVQFLLSLPLSISLMPGLIYLIGRYSLGWPIWTLYGILCAVFLAVCRLRGLRVNRIAWIAAACWIAVSFLSLVDLQIAPNKLYYSVTAYDHNFRSAVTGAFVRAHSLPAANPFFSNGTPRMFRYHYFWFLLCALPVRLSQAIFGYTGLTPRHAVIASSAWAGLAIFTVAALYVRFFFDLPQGTRRRVTLIAILLFGIYGLDIIPALLGSFDGFFPTVDWWNNDQVTGWVDSLLWVPHSIGSLIAFLTGFLILWNRPRFRWQDAFAAGLAFASGVGLSIYVAIVFAFFAAAWTLRLAWKRNWPRAAVWVVSGACAAVLAFPFLRELAGKQGSQGSFLVLEIRHFQPIMQLMDTLRIPDGFAYSLANFLCLPLNFFLELGFFFLAGWRALRKPAISEADSAARWMLVCSVLFCSVVRSHTIQMNDLGARGMLIAQFILVLMGALWLAEGARWKWLVKATLAIGLITTVYELAMMRVFTILADDGIIAGTVEIDPDDELGQRDFDTRQVYEKLDRILPIPAVEQHNPSGVQDIMAGLYANRQFAIMDLGTATTFTGNSAEPERVLEPLKALFAGDRNDPLTVCRDLGIDVLIAKDIDPAWTDLSSWVWRTPALVTTDLARAIDCRSNQPKKVK